MEDLGGGLRGVEAWFDGVGGNHNAACPGPGEGSIGEVVRDEQAGIEHVAGSVPEVEFGVQRGETRIGRLTPQIDRNTGRDDLDVAGDAGEELAAYLMAWDDDRLGWSGRQQHGKSQRSKSD
jgi:hypothetical protein